MYQFPDSTDNIYPPEHEVSDKPINTKKRIKFILVANLLLAIFIVAIAWFLFFFDSNDNPTAVPSPLLSTKNDQTVANNFTPIIIKPTVADPRSEKSAKKSDIKLIIETIEKEKTVVTESKTTGINSKLATKRQEPLSAVDAITQELEKSQKKNISITTSQQKDENSSKNSDLLKPNQVIVNSSKDKLLDSILAKNKKNTNSTEHSLTEELATMSNPKISQESKENIKNSDIHNSVMLKKMSDVDKIMAAMQKNTITAQVTTIDKIEQKVRNLLKDGQNKDKKTNKYVEKIEKEAISNKKEMRILTVKQGESIWDIAVRAYGNGQAYKKILNANPLIKENPDLLKKGVTLRVPK